MGDTVVNTTNIATGGTIFKGPGTGRRPAPSWPPEVTGRPANDNGQPRLAEKPKIPKYHLYTLEELQRLPGPSWQVEGILPAGVLALLYGKEASGKSFLALDFGLSVAAGMDWLGRKAKQGPVVYVAAEGNTGIYARAEAWAEAHGVELGGLPFYVITQPVDMKTVAELVRDIREVCPNAVQITIDTLARNFSGLDENSTKDMSVFVHRVDELRAAFPGATVLVVHHSGKDQSRGDRGSTALRGAVDTSLWLDRTEKADKRTDRLTLRCKKQKDAREFDPIPLRLVAVDEEDGSCVIEARAAVGVEEDWPSSSPRTVRTDQKALEALASFGNSDVTFTTWRNAAKALGMAHSTFASAVKRLVAEEKVEKSLEGNYRLVQVGPNRTKSDLD